MIAATAYRRYAVIGGNTRNSLSPAIHHYFARKMQKPVLYSALSAQEDDFADTVSAFWSGGGSGLNVTVPFKRVAAGAVDKLSGMAKKTGVLNVMHRTPEGSVHGYNTDGAGFVIDLCRVAGKQLDGSRILLIGAGGAAAGILPSLLNRGIVAIFVANRTASKASALAEQAAKHAGAGTRIEGGGLDSINGAFDIIVNAAAGGAGKVKEEAAVDSGVFKKAQLAYDLNYGAAARKFLGFARSCGVELCSDGLGMLIEQAAFSFAIWEGVRPSTGELRVSLGAGQADSSP